MAEKIVSPGVFTRERDLTFLPAGVQNIGAAIVGPTVKGPAMVPTVVSNFAEYRQLFGDSFESGSGADLGYYSYLTSLAAEEYLRHHDTLTVVRVMAGSYSGATSNVNYTAAGTVRATGSMTIVGAFGTHVDDELQITNTDGVEYRFIASDPLGGLPADGGLIYYISTGSSAATYIDNVVAKLNTVSSTVGVIANDGTTALQLTASAFGTVGNTVSVDSGSGATFHDALTLAGGNSSTDVSFVLNTISDGALLNNTAGGEGTNNILVDGTKDNFRWEVANRNTSRGTFSLYIRAGHDTNKRKNILETWNNLSLDPNSTNYIAKRIGDSKMNVRGSGTTDPYIQASGSYLNKSKYVSVAAVKGTLNYLDENGAIRDSNSTQYIPIVGSGSFTGGADGNVQHPQKFYDAINATNMQGYNVASNTQGKYAYEDAINLLKNQDEYDINLLMIPGICSALAGHSTIAATAMQMCEDRGDCFAIIDPVGFGSTISDATSEAENRDTNYAAVYWPWIQISDNYSSKNVWVPASVAMGGVYAFNDKVSAEWFAPAGLNRGGIDRAIQPERKLTHGNRDTLYDSNVNPLATFPNSGVVAFGQKTLQKKASALDRVNVRRLLIAAKKFIASATRYLVFEQNTSETRNRFLSIVNPYLESVQQRQGLYAFKVVMDDSNNTPDVIDRNEMVGQLFLQPTRTAEFIIIDFNVLPTGAAFPE